MAEGSKTAKGLTGIPGDTRRFGQLTRDEKLAVSMQRNSSGVDTQKLYEWLGQQVEIARREAHDALDSLHGPDEYYGMTDAYRQVRRQMRRFDKSLPKTSADRI